MLFPIQNPPFDPYFPPTKATHPQPHPLHLLPCAADGVGCKKLHPKGCFYQEIVLRHSGAVLFPIQNPPFTQHCATTKAAHPQPHLPHLLSHAGDGAGCKKLHPKGLFWGEVTTAPKGALGLPIQNQPLAPYFSTTKATHPKPHPPHLLWCAADRVGSKILHIKGCFLPKDISARIAQHHFP